MSYIIAFATFGFGNYSTEEKDTGFTWVDGKHIYEKTVAITITGGGSRLTPHGITGLDRVISAGGTIKAGSTWWLVPTPPSTAFTNTMQMTILAASIDIYAGAAFSAATTSGYVTIRYTKTS